MERASTPTPPAVLDALEARHRLEEVADPYALYPDVAGDGRSVRIPLVQLDGGDGGALGPALVAELNARGVVARIDGHAVALGLAGTDEAHDVATALSDALHAIRPLHPARFIGRFRPGARLPAGTEMVLPRSDAMRARLVADSFMPDDKKPPVIDLHRSTGPYLSSVDDDRMAILDAAGQIATHAGGLNPPECLEALWTGAFGTAPRVNPDTRDAPPPALARFANLLRQSAKDTLPHVAFCGSGAEANELALRIAAREKPGRRAIVAFEGSFHGRAALVLHATWNPAKRERFEIAGHQARWVPWPEWDHATPEPDGSDLAGWDEARGSDQRREPEGADPLLAAEWASLVATERAIEAGDALAILVEPMQSEGGERHATGRFFARLRALAAAYDVAFLVDEVQTGFHLGGPFFWHQRFPLATPPDLVTIAKKAQIGAVLSRWPTGGSASVNITSAVRGMLQARMMARQDPAHVEAEVRFRLAELAAAHPKSVLSPRGTGNAFGFDLPDAESAQHLIQQRLWQGWMLYAAGAKALRFRLHPHISSTALAGIFERLHRSLRHLESGEDASWREQAPPDEAPGGWPAPASVPEGYRLLRIGGDEWGTWQPAIRALQVANYEPARHDDLDLFAAFAGDPDSIILLLLDPEGALAGTCFAFPLEHVGHADGPRQDPMLGQGNTLYSADTTVDEAHRGHGLGLVLKEAQVRYAMTARRRDGSPRYHYITGRNRIGATAGMQHINERFGAYEVATYDHQYGEADGCALYYRIPLTAPRLPPVALGPPRSVRPVTDLASGLSCRLGAADRLAAATDELDVPWARGIVNGATCNKLSLTNFVTPGVVRAAELLRATAPRGLGHLVLASSRSETCDKGLRAIKFHRREGAVAIAVGPVEVGQTTAAARSLSVPPSDAGSWFGWPRTADPCDAPGQALADLEAALDEAGADRVLAVVIEPLYAKTGRAVPESFWAPLRELTASRGVPLVAVETATAAYRSGRGPWRSDSLPIQVDAVWWYAGGQLGMVFLSDELFVAKKLTLISTWDGDELGLTRLTWELRAARALPIQARGERLERILSAFGDVGGEGLYRSLAIDDADAVAAGLREHGVLVATSDDGRLILQPPLNVSDDELDRLEEALSAVVPA